MKLSIKEAKSIIAIETSMDFKDENEIREVCGFLYDRNVCQSPDARLYLDTLINLRDNGIVPTSCPYCGATLTEGHDVLCHQCFMDIQSLSEGITPPDREDVNPAEEESYDVPELASEPVDIPELAPELADIDIEALADSVIIEEPSEETTTEDIPSEELSQDDLAALLEGVEENVGENVEEIMAEEASEDLNSSDEVNLDDLLAGLDVSEEEHSAGEEDVFDFGNLAAQIEAQIEEDAIETAENAETDFNEVDALIEDISIDTEIAAAEDNDSVEGTELEAFNLDELNLDDFIIEESNTDVADDNVAEASIETVEEDIFNPLNSTEAVSLDTDDLDKLLMEMEAAEPEPESALETITDDSFIKDYEFGVDDSEERAIDDIYEFETADGADDLENPVELEEIEEEIEEEVEEVEETELKRSAKELKKAYGDFNRALSYTRWFYPLLVAIIALGIIAGLVIYFTNKLDEVNSSIQDLANQRILIIDQDGNVQESSRNGAKSKSVNTLVDALELMGGTFSECESKYGPSTMIVTEYTRYYNSLGMSLIYDQKTGKITYIDIDGKGESTATKLAGVSIGETKESVEQYIASLDVDTTPIENGIIAYIGYNGQNIDLEVNYADGKVSLVSATLK